MPCVDSIRRRAFDSIAKSRNTRSRLFSSFIPSENVTCIAELRARVGHVVQQVHQRRARVAVVHEVVDGVAHPPSMNPMTSADDEVEVCTQMNLSKQVAVPAQYRVTSCLSSGLGSQGRS